MDASARDRNRIMKLRLALISILLTSFPLVIFGQCGVERWSVKTGTDADAGLINLSSSSSTTVATMRSWPAPNPIPANNRVAPYETTQWVLNVTLVKYKLESDSDYHLVIQDASGNTMIAEIPSDSCVGSSSPLLAGIQTARAQFDAKYHATTSFQTANIPVQIRGVGMFDFLHGQTGVAPNGIEMHPVLNIVFNPSTDTTAPATSITTPANGSTVNSSITVSATASDNVGVTKVEFYVDGAFKSTLTSSPYNYTWDTTAYSNGTHALQTKAYDAAGNVGTSTTVSVTVSNVGGPPALVATYNSTLKAPTCGSGGKSCDTGSSLINSRGTMSTAEPNQPNTINASCADGTSGTYHSDESLDRLAVATADGTALAGGKSVTITATVWCYNSTDSLDLYYANNASSPSWTLIKSQACTVSSKSASMTASYTLPSTGAQQAIRGTFRYGGSASACGANSGYDDHDDLVFGVSQVGDTVAPTASITAPANGATVTSTISVSATASDNVGVTKVEIYVDSALKSTLTSSPYTWNWNTTTFSNGSHSIFAKAYDAANNVGTSSIINVTVSNTTSPPALVATYNTTYKAPACASGGKSCDSGSGSASLVYSRGTMATAETHAPNTINSSCADGNSGTFHSDESLDSIKIATNDGTALAAGKQVTVTAVVWCYGTTDSLDLYYSASVPGSGPPSWTLIKTQACTVSGQSATLTATYALPSGPTQAVRGAFRYNGSASACGTNSGYDDHDDLMFGVQ